MLLPLSLQFRIVIFSLAAGVLTGIFFDFYRIFRGMSVPKVIMIIEDLLFWTLSSILVFIFLLYVNYAFLGIYVYFFILIGDIMYLKLVSPYFLKMENKIGRGMCKGFRVLFKNLAYGFKLAFFNRNKKNKWN
jgi:spore cortex biosynthesis protein YabQ